MTKSARQSARVCISRLITPQKAKVNTIEKERCARKKQSNSSTKGENGRADPAIFCMLWNLRWIKTFM
jgi:hypothetical protein